MAAPPVAAGQLAGVARVVFYDGVCNACSWLIRQIIANDPNRLLLFCSAQSPKAEPYLAAMGLTRENALTRLVFMHETGFSVGSTAALEIAGYLRPPWPALKMLLAVPLPLREAAYDAVAARRYHWFGRSATCQVPDTALLDRFLDAEDLVAGRCKAQGMPEDAFRKEREKAWERWGR